MGESIILERGVDREFVISAWFERGGDCHVEGEERFSLGVISDKILYLFLSSVWRLVLNVILVSVCQLVSWLMPDYL